MESKRLYAAERKVIREAFAEIKVKARGASVSTYNGYLDDFYSKKYLPRFISKNAKGKPLQDNRRRLDDGSPNPNHNHSYWLLTGISPDTT